jgi:AAA+ ATPase superfamily predicted ATPase
MRANPGGQLSSTEVIGRDKDIKRIWRSLERQSVILVSERRIGKTSILKKMRDDAGDSKVIYFRDLEGIISPLDFVETVLRDVQAHLGVKQKTAIKFQKLIAHVAGLEVGAAGFAVKLPQVAASHWKELLQNVIDDLMDDDDDAVVYFFWDEIPLMLYNIKQIAGEPVAMEILDTLRSLRQTHYRLRMVFTGSIGLHHVLSSLRKTRYANDPTNDMDLIDVLPLEVENATELCRLLLEGENLVPTQREQFASVAALAVDGFPFYIHHLVDELSRNEGVTKPEQLQDVILTAMTDPQDRWHLRYYRERIDIYYSEEERPLALACLDVLSSQSSLAFDELLNFVRHDLTDAGAEALRDLLWRLMRDHYVLQAANGKYQFRFALIKRAWQMQRGKQ